MDNRTVAAKISSGAVREFSAPPGCFSSRYSFFFDYYSGPVNATENKIRVFHNDTLASLNASDLSYIPFDLAIPVHLPPAITNVKISHGGSVLLYRELDMDVFDYPSGALYSSFITHTSGPRVIFACRVDNIRGMEVSNVLTIDAPRNTPGASWIIYPDGYMVVLFSSFVGAMLPARCEVYDLDSMRSVAASEISNCEAADLKMLKTRIFSCTIGGPVKHAGGYFLYALVVHFSLEIGKMTTVYLIDSDAILESALASKRIPLGFSLVCSFGKHVTTFSSTLLDNCFEVLAITPSGVLLKYDARTDDEIDEDISLYYVQLGHSVENPAILISVDSQMALQLLESL